MSTLLDRAQAKIKEIEREPNKYPDFHFYLLAPTPGERVRMEQVLSGIPAFDLWRKLKKSFSGTHCHAGFSPDTQFCSASPD